MNMFWKMKHKKKNEKLSLYCLVDGVFDSLHCEARSTRRRRLRFPTKEITFYILQFKNLCSKNIPTEIQW